MIKQLIPQAYETSYLDPKGLLEITHPYIDDIYTVKQQAGGKYTIPKEVLRHGEDTRKNFGLNSAFNYTAHAKIGGDGSEEFPHLLNTAPNGLFAAVILRQVYELEYFFMKAVSLPALRDKNHGYMLHYQGIIDAIVHFGGFSETDHIRNMFLAIAALEAMSILAAAVAEDLARVGVVMSIRVLRWDAMQTKAGKDVSPDRSVIICLEDSGVLPGVGRSRVGDARIWNINGKRYFGLAMTQTCYSWFMPKLAAESFFYNGIDDMERTWALAAKPNNRGGVSYCRATAHHAGKHLSNLGVGTYCIPAKLTKAGHMSYCGSTDTKFNSTNTAVGDLIKAFTDYANGQSSPGGHELYLRGPSPTVSVPERHIAVRVDFGRGFCDVALMPHVYWRQLDGGVSSFLNKREPGFYDTFGRCLKTYRQVIEDTLSFSSSGSKPPKESTLFGNMSAGYEGPQSIGLTVREISPLRNRLSDLVGDAERAVVGKRLIKEMLGDYLSFDDGAVKGQLRLVDDVVDKDPMPTGYELFLSTTGSKQARLCAAQALLVSDHLITLVKAAIRLLGHSADMKYHPPVQMGGESAEVSAIHSDGWFGTGHLWHTRLKHDASSIGEKPYVVTADQGGAVCDIPGCGGVDYLPGFTAKAAEIASRYTKVVYAMSVNAMLTSEMPRSQKFQAEVEGSMCTYYGPAIYLDVLRNGRCSRLLATTGSEINKFYEEHLPDVIKGGFHAEPDEIYWLRSNQCQRARNKDQDGGISLATPAGRLETLSLWLEETYPQLIGDTEGVRVSVFTKDQLAAAFSSVS